MQIRKRVYWVLFILITLLCYISISKSVSSKSKVKVIIIHSFEEEFEQSKDHNKLILNEFRISGYNPDIRVLYLNCEKYREEDEILKMTEMLQDCKEDGFVPDIILVNDDQAHYSLLKSDHEFVNSVPVVFSGVNFPNYNLISKYDNVTGFEDRIDFKTNFELVKDFSPNDIYQIIFFLDSTFIDLKTRDQLLSSIDTARYEYVDSLVVNGNVSRHLEGTKKTMLRALSFRDASLAEAMWVMGSFNTDGYYMQIKNDYMGSASGEMAQNMKFTTISENFGYRKNLLAGYITTIEIQAKEQVGAAVRILQGTPVSEIPITQSRKEYVADWFVLKKWGIPMKETAKKYRIINVPLQYRYKAELIIIVVLLTSTIILLLTYFIRKSIVANLRREQAFAFLKKKNAELDEANSKLEEQKRALIQARKLAEKAELKHSFLTNMSHEIRTPLNAIVGFTNILLDENNSANLTAAQKDRMVSQVNHNNELLLKLINDILDLSSLEAGAITVEPVPTNVNGIIKDIYNTFLPLINQVDFRLNLSENDDVEALIDPRRFSQLIANLLNNANKFTSSGYIELGVDYEGSDLFVYVKDTGSGIEEEQHSMIFERFYKIDYYKQGTGIGLAISKAIVEKMGGRISVESELGKGSCFNSMARGM